MEELALIDRQFALLNTILLVINLSVVVYGVRKTIAYNKFNRTWSYVERFNSEGMLESKVEANCLVRELEGKSEEEVKAILDHLIDSPEPEVMRRRFLIGMFCNLFTELGVAHKAGAVDTRALVASAGLVVDYWNRLKPYIDHARVRSEPTKVYTAWDRLQRYVVKKGLHKLDLSK